jgi:hypothetical protein
VIRAMVARTAATEVLSLLVGTCKAIRLADDQSAPTDLVDGGTLYCWASEVRNIFGELEEVPLETKLRELVHVEARLGLSKVASVARGRDRYDLLVRGIPVTLLVARTEAEWVVLENTLGTLKTTSR